MIIISQNLTNYDFPIPKDAIFRINLAWISDLDTLEEILEKHKEHKIFFEELIENINNFMINS